MGLTERISNFFLPKESVKEDETIQVVEEIKEETKEIVQKKHHPSADWVGGGGVYNHLFAIGFNGEKTMGEMGPIKTYRPDYIGLRLRSWQAYYESEIAKTLIDRMVMWVIGNGLKLQTQLNDVMLQSEGVKIDCQAFSKITEARWACFADCTNVDYAKKHTLGEIQQIAERNAYIGGDVLVVLRYDRKTGVNVQLIDGQHVCSPVFGNEFYPQILDNGNRILNGVETDDTGRHMAYWVRKAGVIPNSPVTNQFERIPATGTNGGLTQAYLYYGDEMRIDNIRGVPIISVILETLKVLERYKSATLTSAEERSKVVYTVEHDIASTGEFPLANQLTRALDIDNQLNPQLPLDVQGNQLANTIATTTNKQVFNLTQGASLKAADSSKNDLYFEKFYGVNIDIACACISAPSDVIMSKYQGSYSSSRAAVKDFEHTLTVKRTKHSKGFLAPIYHFWLEVEVLTFKLQAPGYLNARLTSNYMLVSAYRNARFVGAVVPHIDPLKEVQAERLKLGESGAAIPLTTPESATEKLGEGEYYSNVIQYAHELEMATKLGIEMQETPQQQLEEKGKNDD